MEEQKKKPGKEEPAKKEQQQQPESKPAKKQDWFDLSVLSRLASQISDDGARDKKKDRHD